MLRILEFVCVLISKGVFFLFPHLRRVSLKNLAIAFPEKSEEERLKIAKGAERYMGLILAHSLAVNFLSEEWMKKHFDYSEIEWYIKDRENPDRRPILFATGHLGSFELLPRLLAYLRLPISFVARELKPRFVQNYVVATREKGGNKIISRKGAIKKMISTLRAGRDVAILVDQNVRDKHGIFVPWFGIDAATTAAPSLVLCKTPARLAVAASYIEGRRFRVVGYEVHVDEIVNNTSLSNEEKFYRIAEKMSFEFEKLVRACPEQWFWMHKRYRTRPKGETEPFYE